MKKFSVTIFCLILFAAGCTNSGSYSNPDPYYPEDSSVYEEGFDDGYDFASENDIDNFDDCQNEFDTGDAEDGCNEYVKEEYSGYQSYNGYECTEDCSGHEAGYNWAEAKGIEDENDCDGNSNSFIEGCISYVEDNY